MVRYVAVPALAILSFLVAISPTSAGWGWCPIDPIVKLNGAELQIWAAVQEPFVEHVTGPVDFRIGVPREVATEIVFLDEGFNGHGEVVWFVPNGQRVNADGTFVVDIHVHVPLSQQVIEGRKAEMLLWVIYPDGSRQDWVGMANNMRVSIVLQGETLPVP